MIEAFLYLKKYSKINVLMINIMKKYLFIVLLVGAWSCDAIKKAETIVPTKIKGKGMYVKLRKEENDPVYA